MTRESGPRIAVDWYASRRGMDGFVDYATELTQALARAGADLVALVPDHEHWTAERIEGVVATARIPIAEGATRTERTENWYERELPAALAETAHDVVLAPAFFAPRPAERPVVLTVHDLSFERAPEAFSEANRELYGVRGRADACAAAAVLAVSATSAVDAVERWGIGPDRVVATPLGPSIDVAGRSVEAARAAVAERFGLAGGYLLVVSPMHRRKNLPRVVAEHLALPRERRAACPLVLVNADIPGVHEILSAAGADETVRVLPRVSDDDLRDLHLAATALLHGSDVEGFGLPAANAMAAGVPVVANPAPGLTEVLADVAVWADVHEPGAFAAAIARVQDDGDLRTRLGAAGRARAAGLTWERCAERTLATLTAAAAGAQLTCSLAAEASEGGMTAGGADGGVRGGARADAGTREDA